MKDGKPDPDPCGECQDATSGCLCARFDEWVDRHADDNYDPELDGHWGADA